MVEAKRRRKPRANGASSNVLSFPSARSAVTTLQSHTGIEEVRLGSNLSTVAPNKNVVSLTSARMEREWRNNLYAAGSVDIDSKDIKRFCGIDENGAYVLTLGDRIVLGPRAEIQVQDLFWRYGLRKMPKTWGELLGNWKYCRLVNLWLFSLSGESPSVQRGLLAQLEKRYPGHEKLLRCLMVGDLDGAHRWHQQQNKFASNATDRMLTRELEKGS